MITITTENKRFTLKTDSDQRNFVREMMWMVENGLIKRLGL